jgi:hypothetical protein
MAPNGALMRLAYKLLLVVMGTHLLKRQSTILRIADCPGVYRNLFYPGSELTSITEVISRLSEARQIQEQGLKNLPRAVSSISNALIPPFLP